VPVVAEAQVHDVQHAAARLLEVTGVGAHGGVEVGIGDVEEVRGGRHLREQRGLQVDEVAIRVAVGRDAFVHLPDVYRVPWHRQRGQRPEHDRRRVAAADRHVGDAPVGDGGPDPLGYPHRGAVGQLAGAALDDLNPHRSSSVR
jgi:hypothetical protein